jgi:hypothetical protein
LQDKDVDILLIDSGDLHDGMCDSSLSGTQLNSGLPGTGLSDGYPPGGVDAHEVRSVSWVVYNQY